MTVQGCGAIECANECGGDYNWATCPNTRRGRDVAAALDFVMRAEDADIEVRAKHDPSLFRDIAARADFETARANAAESQLSTLKAAAEGMADGLETLIERFDMYLPHSNEPHSNVAVRTRRMMEGGRNAVKAYRAATSGDAG